MDLLLEKLWKYVARDQSLSMQRRLYRLICLITALLCFLVIFPINFFQNLPIVINIGVALFGFFTLYLYWLTFRGQDHVVVYFVVLLLLLDLVWFPNAGSSGSIVYYFAAAVVYVMALTRGVVRWGLLGALFLDISALLIIEHLFPRLLVPFNTPNDRLIDLLTGVFCSMLAGSTALWVVITNFDWEHAAIARVSEDLAKSEKKYREVVETASTVVIRMDQSGAITFINTFAESLFGFKRAEIIGQNITTLFTRATPSDDVDGISRIKAVLQAPGQQVQFESENSCSNGRTIWINWMIQPIYGEKNALTEFLCIGTDITERKALEEKRKQLDQQALHVQKIESLGVLAGGIAHDFNNILTSIVGNISLVQMDLDPSSRDYHRLGEAERASMHARDLTMQLLTFSRGGLPVKQTMSLGPLLQDSVKFSLRGSHVTSKISIGHELWPVDADPGQLGQVLNNLVINACQAMPSGGMVTIDASSVLVDDADGLLLPAGRYVKMSIQDEGTGIMEEHLQRIFDPYFTTKQAGSGLGLAVVFSIIKNHQGQINVASQLGKGSTFTIYLPASTQAPVAQRAADPALHRGAAHVLVMDDEELVREVAGSILETFGYTVAFAKDGGEAVTLYEQAAASAKPFDIVIMDLTIPGGMGGKEAIGRLRTIDPQVRAIASSGYSNDPIMANFREYGFSAVIAKPYRPTELATMLQSMIEKQNGPLSSPGSPLS